MPDGKIIFWNNKLYCGNGETTYNFIFTVAVYIGNDVSNRFINLGYTPEFVLIFQRGASISTNYAITGGLCLKGYPSTNSTGNAIIKIVDNGFAVRCNAMSSSDGTNQNGLTYNYIAY